MTVTGVLSPTGSQDDQLIFTPLATAQKILDKPGQVSMVEVAALCKDCPINEMVAQITDAMPTAKVMAIQQVVKSRMETLEQFKRFSYGLSLVVVLIGSLVVLVTLMGSVRERTEEIGIFRAIGFRQMHIMRLIFLETSIVSTLAGIIGYGIGMGSIWLGFVLVPTQRHGIPCMERIPGIGRRTDGTGDRSCLRHLPGHHGGPNGPQSGTENALGEMDIRSDHEFHSM